METVETETTRRRCEICMDIVGAVDLEWRKHTTVLHASTRKMATKMQRHNQTPWGAAKHTRIGEFERRKGQIAVII
eukprot:560905-Ditylum_brightwellii.AAC.1